MNFYEHEMRVLFCGSELLSADTVFISKTAIGKIDTDVRAKLQFVTTGEASKYDAIKLTVINRKNGVIDSQLFRFPDIIGNRNGYLPYIRENDGEIGWYGFSPSVADYDRIRKMLQDYMAMFAGKEISYSEQLPWERMIK